MAQAIRMLISLDPNSRDFFFSCSIQIYNFLLFEADLLISRGDFFFLLYVLHISNKIVWYGKKIGDNFESNITMVR